MRIPAPACASEGLTNESPARVRGLRGGTRGGLPQKGTWACGQAWSRVARQASPLRHWSQESHRWAPRKQCVPPRTRREGAGSGPRREVAVMAGSGRPPEGRQGRGPGLAAEQREEQSPPDTRCPHRRAGAAQVVMRPAQSSLQGRSPRDLRGPSTTPLRTKKHLCARESAGITRGASHRVRGGVSVGAHAGVRPRASRTDDFIRRDFSPTRETRC